MRRHYEMFLMTRNDLRKDPAFMAEYNIATLMLGELETMSKRDGKEITDAMLQSVAKKMIKSNNETVKLLGDKDKAKTSKLLAENSFMETFLPPKLTDEAVRNILESSVFGSVGEALKAIDNKCNGCYDYDRAVASKIAKELL